MRKSGQPPPSYDALRRRELAHRLTRGVGRLLAVVVLAGAAGILLGNGLAHLFDEDSAPAPNPPADGTPAAGGSAVTSTTATRGTATTTGGRPGTTTAPGPAPVTVRSGGRLRVEVLSTIVHHVTPAGAGGRRARIGVHVRLTNSHVRPLRLGGTLLRVGDAYVRAAHASSAAGPLPSELAVDGVLDRTLRFDTDAATTRMLASAPIELRIATKRLALKPIVGRPIAAP